MARASLWPCALCSDCGLVLRVSCRCDVRRPQSTSCFHTSPPRGGAGPLTSSREPHRGHGCPSLHFPVSRRVDLLHPRATGAVDAGLCSPWRAALRQPLSTLPPCRSVRVDLFPPSPGFSTHRRVAGDGWASAQIRVARAQPGLWMLLRECALRITTDENAVFTSLDPQVRAAARAQLLQDPAPWQASLLTPWSDHRGSAVLHGRAVGLRRARPPRASKSRPAARSSSLFTPLTAPLVVLSGPLHARRGDLALGLGAQAAPMTSTCTGTPPPGAPNDLSAHPGRPSRRSRSDPSWVGLQMLLCTLCGCTGAFFASGRPPSPPIMWAAATTTSSGDSRGARPPRKLERGAR